MFWQTTQNHSFILFIKRPKIIDELFVFDNFEEKKHWKLELSGFFYRFNQSNECYDWFPNSVDSGKNNKPNSIKLIRKKIQWSMVNLLESKHVEIAKDK